MPELDQGIQSERASIGLVIQPAEQPPVTVKGYPPGSVP
jgi:hypothetical protein